MSAYSASHSSLRAAAIRCCGKHHASRISTTSHNLPLAYQSRQYHREHLHASPSRPHSHFPLHNITTTTTTTQTRPPSRNASQQSTSRSHPSKPAKDHDRGPASAETTTTDFSALDIFSSAGAPTPTTAIDVCSSDGFVLDSGLKVSDGDGVLLVGGEAFVWRPWMGGDAALQGGDGSSGGAAAGRGKAGIVHGSQVIAAARAAAANIKPTTAGVGIANAANPLHNAQGQLEIAASSLGVLRAVWPKPDLLIIGTGRYIRPLSAASRAAIQELGMRVEVLDTRNAASQFNLLATERGVGEVAAGMLCVGMI